MENVRTKITKNTPKHHKLWWQSSYDRGLDIALFMWPDIKAKFPDAEFHISYGWTLFDKVTGNNPERQQWKKSVESMMNQPGIIHHGRVGQQKLKELRQQCGILLYPTYFTEISFIGGMEAQSDGLVPVTMTLAALDETVQSGIKIEGDIKDIEVQQKFLSELLDLMGDDERWKRESSKAKRAAKKINWGVVAEKWSKYFQEPVSQPLVSVVTPTIRTGFWNIMAENLSRQTYKNFEWIIVDDYKEDRSEIAQKYASKYNLKVRYLRGDKDSTSYSRRYGLVRANNKAWQNAQGELLVWLQDFILIPETGIEHLVDLYRHHPNALLAPTDDYFNSVTPNRENTEDWFDGNTDVLTTHHWRNPRNEYLGIRKTDNPYDFEMNYSAIPKKIVEHLNGWWEFLDDGLGFDNTEIAYRALEAGYYILLDDTNVAKCINLWPHIGGTGENILSRERQLNPPRYAWFVKQMQLGKLPLVRDEKLNDAISLPFDVPDDIEDRDCAEWIDKNALRLIDEWGGLK